MRRLHRFTCAAAAALVLSGAHAASTAAAAEGLPTHALTEFGTVVGTDESGAKAWADAQRWYASNDFAQAQSSANAVGSGPFKKDAQAMLNRIKSYVVALQDGSDAEAHHDSEAAIAAYTEAVHIKSDGPGDPTERIARIQRQAAALQKSQQAEEASRQKDVAKRRVQAAQLMEKGIAAEKVGDLQAAMNMYMAAFAANPANRSAHDSAARIKEQLRNSPQVDVRVATAVRAFYAGNFAEAEQQLAPLSAAPGTNWRGAACFYLGASRLYEIMQQEDTPAEAAFADPKTRAAFAQAKALGYTPVPAFVSPLLLRFWQGLP